MSNLLEKTGKIVFLRAHDLGTGFGPPNDALDVEAVFILNTLTDGAYGFQLRNDANFPARQAMFSLLRDAFVNNLPVTTDFLIDTGKKNGIAIRVALTRSQIVHLPPVVSGQVIRGQALPAPSASGKSAAKGKTVRRRPKSRKAR
jgi:hypothetical protein